MMNGFPIFIPVTKRNGKFKGKKLMINVSMISMLRSLQDLYNNPNLNLKGTIIRIGSAYDIEVEEDILDIRRMITSEINSMRISC